MDVIGQESRENIGRRSQSRFVLVLMFLVSVILLASSLYSAEASVFKKARESVIDAAAPVLEALARPLAFLQDRIGDVRDYFNVLEQNEALRQENAELRQWMDEALRLRAELKSYDRLQEFAADLETQPIDAFIVGESNEAYSRSMLVNAGAGDGVRRGMAVVDDHGLLGRIVEVGNRASRVLLLTDVQSGVPVYVEETGLEGILKGRTGARPVIDFAAASAAVAFRPGQRVVSSGAGGALPRGVAVGKIVGDAKGQAVVELDARPAKARLVRVVNYQFPTFERSEIQADPNAPLVLSRTPSSLRPTPLQPPTDSPSQRAARQAAEAIARRTGRPVPADTAAPVAAPAAQVAPPQNAGLAPDAPPPAPPPANDGD